MVRMLGDKIIEEATQACIRKEIFKSPGKSPYLVTLWDAPTEARVGKRLA